MLEEAPRAGTGVHRWIFASACQCVEAKLPERVAFELIRDRTRGCGRRVPASEIRSALKDAQRKISLGSGLQHRWVRGPI